MSNRPRPSQTPERRQLTRRQVAAQQREANVQRRAILAVGGVILLALLLIVAGIAYDRFYLPNQTLKQVNGEKLTRGEYEELLRVNTIQQMAQALQFSKLFGAQQSFGQGGTFDQQIVEANAKLTELGTSRSRQQPVDESLVSQWVDRQIVEQAAKQQYQIDPAQGEVDQLLVAQLGSVIDTTPPLTDTTTVTATAETSATEGASAAASAEASAAATTTATALPTATAEPAEATAKAGQVVDALYTELTNILGALPEEATAQQKTPHVTKDEIAQALRVGFREQLVREKVGEKLVPEVPANDTTPPNTISVRHLLLKVPPAPLAATPNVTETAETAEATATAESTPSPTPSPEELEQMFAERKKEAEALYQQVKDKPDMFVDLIKSKSEDTGSAAEGGLIGPFDRQGNVVGQQGQTLVLPFVEAAWALKEGEISPPIRTQFGWHIIQRLPEDPKTKLERLRQEAVTKWLDEQRQKATIVPAPTATPTEIAPVTTETPEAAPAAPETTGTATP